MRGRRPQFLLLAFAAALALAGGAAPTASPPAATVRVSMRDFAFRLSTATVGAGLVRFLVVNQGSERHDFAIAGRKTRVLKHGEHAVLLVHFKKPGRYAFRCAIPGHSELGMKGVLLVIGKKGSKALGQAPGGGGPPPPASSPGSALALTPIGTFDRPVYVTSPPDDPHRLFVVEQAGVSRVLVDGVLQPEPFLDISSRVKAENETGLLSMAFAPDYSQSGLFYVYFTSRVGNGDVNVVEFRRIEANPSLADSDSGRLVLEIVKPWENHNGGMMQFGPDGYLYVSVGDGDSGVLHEPGAFAQTVDDLLGNILRIDPRQSGDEPYTVPPGNPFVGAPGARPEIWAYGLRNPWRFWIDPVTGDMYVGDVGLGAREEIDYVAGGRGGGENFGWPCFEGGLPFDTAATCTSPVPPLLEYDHSGGECGVIAGLVLRDPRLPALDGSFLYADLCGGELRTLRAAAGALVETEDVGIKVQAPDSFGQDALRRVYVATLDGAVYRIDPASG